MKLKLDENLPESLLSELTALGHDVDNVRLEGLAGHADPDVWKAAQGAGRFLITQDLDFSDLRLILLRQTHLRRTRRNGLDWVSGSINRPTPAAFCGYRLRGKQTTNAHELT
jgi:hypothetical protein